MIEYNILKKYKVDYDKLIKYGFIKEKENYIYEIYILDNSFKIEILINDNEVIGKIYDMEFNEEYTNFRLENNNGTFSNKIKEEYEKILIDIRDKCYINKYFISDQANRITNFIITKYNVYPSYEWEKFPNDAVFKNNDTKKWFGLIMNINESKLHDGNKNIDVLDIKLEPSKILSLLNVDGFYPAYHMNKKYWISISLDDKISDEKILELIDESFKYTIKK